MNDRDSHVTVFLIGFSVGFILAAVLCQFIGAPLR